MVATITTIWLGCSISLVVLFLECTKPIVQQTQRKIWERWLVAALLAIFAPIIIAVFIIIELGWWVIDLFHPPKQ